MESFSWQDLRALLGRVRLLYIHRIVENLNRSLEVVDNVDAYIGTIDKIKISEESGDILRAFTIMAFRK